jgi:hypothetical protein
MGRSQGRYSDASQKPFIGQMRSHLDDCSPVPIAGPTKRTNFGAERKASERRKRIGS